MTISELLNEASPAKIPPNKRNAIQMDGDNSSGNEEESSINLAMMMRIMHLVIKKSRVSNVITN